MEQLAQARELFVEYAAGLGIDLCFQNFEQELASLPGSYAPPDGRLLLALDNDTLAACVAFRKLDDATCEMKRLYVRPKFRGQHLGQLDFREIEPYTVNPIPGALFMELQVVPNR